MSESVVLLTLWPMRVALPVVIAGHALPFSFHSQKRLCFGGAFFVEGEPAEDVVISKMQTTTAHGAIAGKTQTKGGN